jgi:hypothetical protein
MKRILLLVVGILSALVLAAPMALAQSDNGGAPEVVSVTYPADLIAQYPGHCSFPMEVTISGKGKTIKQGNGGTITTAPGQVITITNKENSEEVTFNVTGSFHDSTLENGNVQTVMTGRNFGLDPVAGTFIAIGHFTYVSDPTRPPTDSNVVPVSGTGRMIDVCALLK